MTGQAGSKAELRVEARRLRAAAAAGRGRAAAAVAANALAHVPLPAGALIGGYWPVRDELDPRPLLQQLAALGCRLALPVVRGPGLALAFRHWAIGDPLEAAGFGLSVPLASAPEVVPAVLLVPLLAFDAAGYRLGYGGGFYDMTLAERRAGGGAVLAVGLAYAAQARAELPHEAWDQPLDWVVTELEARKFR